MILRISLSIFCLLVSQLCFSQKEDGPLKYRISLSFDFDDQITKEQRSSIKKDFYEILISTKRFDFILGSNNAIDTVHFKVTFGKNLKMPQYYAAEMSLVTSDGKIINKEIDRILIPEKLNLEARELFLKLFLGNYYNATEKKVIKNKLSSKVEKVLKKMRRRNALKKKKKMMGEEEVPDEEEEEEPSIDEINENNVKNNKAGDSKDGDETNSAKISNFENSPDLDLSKTIQKKAKRRGVMLFNSSLLMKLGHEREIVKTSSVANVETNTSRLTVGVQGFLEKEGGGQVLLDGEVGIVMGGHEFGFRPKFNILGGYLFRPGQDFLSIGPILEIGTFNFAGLAFRGDGIRRSTHKGILGGVGASLKLRNILERFVINAGYLTTLITSASFGDLDSIATSGSKVILVGSARVYKNYGVGLKFTSLDIESSSIEGDISNFLISDTSGSVFATYKF